MTTTVNIGAARAERTPQHQAALDLLEVLLALEPDELEEVIAGALAAARAGRQWRGEAYAAPWTACAGLADLVYGARVGGQRPDPRAIAGALGGVVRALDALPAPERLEWGRRVARAAVGLSLGPVSQRVLAALAALAEALAAAG